MAALEAKTNGNAVETSAIKDDVELKLRPVLQLDGRFFGAGGTDTFLARRVRPAVEATLFRIFQLRITPELGTAPPTVVDAYANVTILPELQLRFGKTKSPVGLERLQSDTDVHFTERALPSALLPDRDIGVQLHGELLQGTVTYAGGIFNGALDGQQLDGADTNSRKDLEGRIFVRPFASTTLSALKYLGLGIAGTSGEHDGAPLAYRTTGQNVFFSYAADAITAGTEKRVSPQGYFYLGPVGILGEWVRASQKLIRPTTGGTVVNATAWAVTASVLVTGEDASYTTVHPRRVFDPKNGGFGAIELDARWSTLQIDSPAFDRNLADANKSARRATEYAFGVQWHLAPAIKLVVDLSHTKFEGGQKGADRDAETVFITRLQVAY